MAKVPSTTIFNRSFLRKVRSELDDGCWILDAGTCGVKRDCPYNCDLSILSRFSMSDAL